MKKLPSAFAGALFLAVVFLAMAPANAQLRIVTYNTLKGPNTGFETVIEAIGEENRGGIARPVDVLLLQEQTGPTGTTQSIVSDLNNIYGAGTYARGNLIGDPFFSDIRQGIVYNTNTVELIGEQGIGSTGSNIQPRQVLRYQLRPVGYDSSADFYAYNSHYKASPADEPSNGTTNGARRLAEAQTIRTNSDNVLGEGAHVIYAGDFNMQSSSEDAFGHLISSGAGQAFDPINQLGDWNHNSFFAEWHTQSPCEFACSPGFASGGLDDRFDFQLVTGELIDNEGLSYIPGSYHTFGNDGSTYNNAINVNNNIVFSGITSFTKTQVLDALESASDHLPVIADYQLPAVLDAVAGNVPAMLSQGQSFNLDVLIRNAASVLTANGADELDYSYTTTGDLSGSGSGIEFALDLGDTHFVSLDTSTEGFKSGSIIVTTTSQSAANAQVTIPISYQVGEGGPIPAVIARAIFPNVADDINVTGFQFSGDFTIEETDVNSGGTLPVGSDARTLAFSTPSDMFGLEDRADDSPFTMLDDSAGSNPSDAVGIIKTSDTDNFFGVVDSVNGDNAGPLTAEWTFDISSAVAGLELSIDMAAMGDFEAPGGAEDIFTFEVDIDGGGFTTLFAPVADEAVSQTYTLEDGDMFTLDDPLSVGGTLLDNNFQTFTTPIAGTGNTLTLRFTGFADGSSEAFAFRNIVIEGLVDAGLPGDFNDDGVVDVKDYVVWRDNLGAVDESPLNGNGDGINGIDEDDYLIWQNAFGNMSSSLASSPATVPEPTTVALVALASFLVLHRRIKMRA